MKSRNLILVIILIFYSAASAYIEDPEKGMMVAMRDYQNGNYKEAYKKFKSLADHYSLDGHNSSFRFMAAKSLYKGEEYAAAITLFDEYLNLFPRSHYASAALLLKGHSLYRMGDL